MLKVLVLAAVLIGGLYLLVAKTRIEDIGFRELKDGEPDTALGVVVMILAVTLMGVLMFVPSREGAPPRARIHLWGLAAAGLAWGVTQLPRPKAKRRRRSA